MFKLYVGCALHHAPPEFIESVERLRDELARTYEILRFVGLRKAPPLEVFRRDSQCVIDCDLFLAICDYPSLGLGYEIALALSLGKPVLAVAACSSEVSFMIQGIDKPGFVFKRYDQLDEVPELLEFMRTLFIG